MTRQDRRWPHLLPTTPLDPDWRRKDRWKVLAARVSRLWPERRLERESSIAGGNAMNVREIMNPSVVSCRAEDSLHRASQIMWENDVGAVPVVDEGGRLVGIVTDRDICMAAYTQGIPLQGISVSSAMAQQVWSCHATDSLRNAEELMSSRQVRRIPVVDGDNRPIGMLSLNDLVRHADSSRHTEHEGDDLVHTLAAI